MTICSCSRTHLSANAIQSEARAFLTGQSNGPHPSDTRLRRKEVSRPFRNMPIDSKKSERPEFADGYLPSWKYRLYSDFPEACPMDKQWLCVRCLTQPSTPANLTRMAVIAFRLPAGHLFSLCRDIGLDKFVEFSRIPGGPPGLCGAGPTRTLPGFTGQIRGINNSKSRDWCTHRDSQRCSHRYRTCAILALLAHFLLLRRDRIAECFNILFKQDRLGHRTARISTCLRKMRIPKSCFPSKLDRENGDHRIVKIFFSILPDSDLQNRKSSLNSPFVGHLRAKNSRAEKKSVLVPPWN